MTIESIVLSALVFAVTIYSASIMAPTWDEGNAINRGLAFSRWARAVVVGPNRLVEKLDPSLESDDPRGALDLYFARFRSRFDLFSQDALAVGVRHATVLEGHPTGASIAISTGSAIAGIIPVPISEKTTARLIGAFLFALALGAVYRRVAKTFGRLAALVSALGVMCCPRVFAHAQIAGGDSLLVSSWLIAWALFDSVWRSKRAAALWGLALGASFCAKFSGLLIVAPFGAILAFDLLFAKLPRREKFRRVELFALGVLVGVATFFLANPTLWSRPIEGAITFWNLNVQRKEFNIPVYFFGELFTPRRSPPWWNGFFWVVATTPLLLLILAIFGVVRQTLAALIARRRWSTFSEREDPAPFARRPPLAPSGDGARPALSALALGLTLPFVRCFPGVPVHDGARLLIASCAFWGVLAGVGVASFGRARTLSILAACAALGLGAFNLVKISPTYLSFYSAAVGGIDGAFDKGLEPTYYWDALDRSTVAALNAELAREKKEGRPTGVLFGSFSSETLDLIARSGKLDSSELRTISDPEFQWRPEELEPFAFYVVQFRPSGLTPLDLELMSRAKPVGKRYLADPLEPFWQKKSAKREIVLLEVFRIDDVRALLEEELAKERAAEF